MTAMKDVLYLILLLVVSAFSTDEAVASPQIKRTQTILHTDTVTRTDTIVTQEVVRRYDVVTRTEEVMRVDTIIRSDGKTIVKRGVELPPSGMDIATDMPVIARDTVRVIVRDTVFFNAGVAGLPQKEGGSYMWVPDSLSRQVGGVLAGGADVSVMSDVADTKERVTFRGDTIPMMLRDRNLGRFDRGLFNWLFIPAGMWQIGVTASYGSFDTKDLEVLDLLSDIDISGKAFSIKPYFSYFIKSNMSVGMRLAYTTGRADVGSFRLDIDEDMNFNLKDIMYRSESYSAALTFTQFFGMARRGRFGIFNEVELAFASGWSDFSRPYNGQPRLTHTTTTKASLNFSPGVSVFIMDPVCFNVSFGVFGFNLKNEKQTVDGEDMGSRFTSGANFRFNIFNINFGIAVNI